MDGRQDPRWGRTGVLGRLNREWAQLQDDPEARSTCRRWGHAGGSVSGVGCPADVLRRVPGDPDALLGWLLRAAAGGESLAARIVLQALLGKVVLMAGSDPAATIDDYVTALWCEIAAYPLDRRPRSVAANLALDTLKAVHREHRSLVDLATAPELVLVTADLHPRDVIGRHEGRSSPGTDVAGVIARARAHRLVDAATGDLLRSVYAEGLSGVSAGHRHGLSPGAVRVRCSRAVKVLAAHADLLADAG